MGLLNGHGAVERMEESARQARATSSGFVPTLKSGQHAARISMATNNTKRKRLNLGITKHRNWAVTVNNSLIVWDPQIEPKGLIGGHLNTQSYSS